MIEYILSFIAFIIAIFTYLILNRKIKTVARMTTSPQKILSPLEEIIKLKEQLQPKVEPEPIISEPKKRGRPPTKESPKKQKMLELIEQLLKEVETIEDYGT